MAVLLVALCSATAQSHSPEIQNSKVSLSLQEIVGHVAETQALNRDRIRSYTVTREYRLYGGNSSEADSQVMADISFVPPTRKDYEITKTLGSGQGEKIVRKVLDHEQEMASNWESTALTAENYEFQLLGDEISEGRRCYVLQIDPKRESKDLIKGKAWIDAESFNVRRIEGEPAKSPSWWVKHLQLTLRFSEVKGMWLQTGAQANADIRMLGKRVLTSRDVDYRTGDIVAQKIPPARKTATRLVGAGVLVR